MPTLLRPKIIPQEESIKKPFLVGLSSLVISGATLAVFWSQLPPQVPLFFSKPWGDAQLAQPLYLALPLGISLLLLITNSLLAQLISDYAFLRKMLMYGVATACLLSSITVLRIILLIT